MRPRCTAQAWVCVGLLVLAGWRGMPLMAQPPAAAPAPPAATTQPWAPQPSASQPAAVEPQADDVLRRMGACLGSARQFSFESNSLMDDMLADGQRAHVLLTQQVTVRRPDRLHALAEGDRVNAEYWYDGSTLAMHDRAQNTYATIRVPPTIDALFDHLAERYGLTMPLCDLLFADPYAGVRPRLRSGTYLGLHGVRGVNCHHLAFRQESVDWQVWVQADDPPVPRLVVITYKELPGDPQFIAFLDHWDLTAAAPDTAFQFKPPEGAQQVEMMRADRRPEAVSEPRKEPAP